MKRSFKTMLASVSILALTVFLVEKTGIGATPEASAIQFRDVTQQAGIHLSTITARLARSFCRKPWDQEWPSSTMTTTAGRTFFW